MMRPGEVGNTGAEGGYRGGGGERSVVPAAGASCPEAGRGGSRAVLEDGGGEAGRVQGPRVCSGEGGVGGEGVPLWLATARAPELLCDPLTGEEEWDRIVP